MESDPTLAAETGSVGAAAGNAGVDPQSTPAADQPLKVDTQSTQPSVATPISAPATGPVIFITPPAPATPPAEAPTAASASGPARPCADCQHYGKRLTCFEPVAAGLIPAGPIPDADVFGLVWPEPEHAAGCPAYLSTRRAADTSAGLNVSRSAAPSLNDEVTHGNEDDGTQSCAGVPREGIAPLPGGPGNPSLMPSAPSVVPAQAEVEGVTTPTPGEQQAARPEQVESDCIWCKWIPQAAHVF